MSEAMQFSQEGKYNESNSLLYKILDSVNIVYGENSHQTAFVRNAIGFNFLNTQNYDSSLFHLRIARDIFYSIYRDNQTEVAINYDNLGIVYAALEKNDSAIVSLRKSYFMKNQIKGNEIDISSTSLNLAGAFFKTAQIDSAIFYYNITLSLRETVYTKVHANLLIPLNFLADCYKFIKDNQSYENTLRRILEINISIHGKESTELNPVLYKLADFYKSTKNYKQLERIYLSFIQIFSNVNGPEHITTAAAMNNLAETYRLSKEYAKAKDYYFKVLEIFDKENNGINEKSAAALNNLATLYQTEKDMNNAEKFYIKVEEILKKLNKTKGEEYVFLMNNIATLNANQKNYSKAIKYFELAIKSLNIEKDKNTLINIYKNMAFVYKNWGKTKEEKEYLKKAENLEKQK